MVPGFRCQPRRPTWLPSWTNWFPVIVKSAHVAAGRGMKLLRSAPSSRVDWISNVKPNAFGHQTFSRKYLDAPNHWFQVFGDSSGHVIHFADRDVPFTVASKIIRSNVSILTMIYVAVWGLPVPCDLGKYKERNSWIPFARWWILSLEVNTRLQVDIRNWIRMVGTVKMQTNGSRDFIHDTQQMRAPRGHSIEFVLRKILYGRLPSTGFWFVHGWRSWPSLWGWFWWMWTITPFYDPMIARLRVDEPRSRAIQNHRVLGLCGFGVHTTFHIWLNFIATKNCERHDDTRFAKRLLPMHYKP